MFWPDTYPPESDILLSEWTQITSFGKRTVFNKRKPLKEKAKIMTKVKPIIAHPKAKISRFHPIPFY